MDVGWSVGRFMSIIRNLVNGHLKQTSLNIILSTVRNYHTEKEIFDNMKAINGEIRSYIKYFMHQDIQVSHPYKEFRVTHRKLEEVCSNT